MRPVVTFLVAALLLQSPNTLSHQEAKDGWKLLFDGKTTHGWHNFKKQDVGSGWVVTDGVLTSEKPGNAGDILTNDSYDWFELELDFRLQKGQNSGVMYHVQNSGLATWHSGPEIQIYDDQGAGGQKTGFLYLLYDSKVDATKPVGEWNEMRLVISPKLCRTYINGVLYHEYVLGSEEFKARLAKTKFAEFPQFASSNTGSICIQGDHGVVSFRDIKIKPLKG